MVDLDADHRRERERAKQERDRERRRLAEEAWKVLLARDTACSTEQIARIAVKAADEFLREVAK